MQDASDARDAAPDEAESFGPDDLSRREMLEKIERFAYAAPAMALLVAPIPAAGYGRGACNEGVPHPWG